MSVEVFGAPEPGPITLVPYDAAWPARYEREAARIRAALGDGALRIEHIGSTSVPGLAAKPIVDIDVAVADVEDDAAFVPALERAGYEARKRELAVHDWAERQDYADAKGPLIAQIAARGEPGTAASTAAG